MGNVIAILLTFFFLSCAANKPEVIADDSKKEIPEFFTGSYKNLNSEEITASSLSTKARIIIFSQSFCHTCQGEAKMLTTYFSEKGSLPKNVDILSILAYEIAEDALDFVEEFKVPWSVGVDEKGELFRNYCGGPPFPCTLIEVPGKGIIHRSKSGHTIEELESYTGKWEF